MGSRTQKLYDLGFNIRYLSKTCISVTIHKFTGYFSDAMPFAFRIEGKPATVAHDRMWGDSILRDVSIIQAGKSYEETIPLHEFIIMWKQALNKNIIKAASSIAKHRMGLIEQEVSGATKIRTRRNKR